jgi:hypothetical protein
LDINKGTLTFQKVARSQADRTTMNARYFEEGNPAYRRRMLYNDICARARHYVRLDEIQDPIIKGKWVDFLATWLKPDASAEDYCCPIQDDAVIIQSRENPLGAAYHGAMRTRWDS